MLVVVVVVLIVVLLIVILLVVVVVVMFIIQESIHRSACHVIESFKCTIKLTCPRTQLN